MSSPSTTALLLASLPESIWAEANRRLRLMPELWALTEDGRILGAFCGLGDDLRHWQPGRLALTAYATRHPECNGSAEKWLSTDGRERMNSAILQLTTSGQPLHPVDEAVPAALALCVRGYTTKDWKSIAADATADPERWRVPLQYLWGLLKNPLPLFAALMQTGLDGAKLAGQCLVVNQTVTEAVEIATHLQPDRPTGTWLACAQAMTALGQRDYAQTVIRFVSRDYSKAGHTFSFTQAKDAPFPSADFHTALDQALLLAATGDYVLARPALTTMWEQTRQLTATLAGSIGQLALAAADPVAAIAGYIEALAEQPHDSYLRAGLARAYLAANQPTEALTTLRPTTPVEAPALQLVRARTLIATGSTAEAHELLKQLDLESLPPAENAEAAHIFFDLGLLSDAVCCMHAAANAARTQAHYYLTAAQWLLADERAAQAHPLALEAVALQPHNAAARELLGEASLKIGDHSEALKHFQSAVVFEPTRHTAGLGLARAALAAGQAALAHESARRVLAARPAPTPNIEGQAHVILGQSLSAQGNADDAFEHFHRASALVPHAPEPWHAIAKHHTQRGETSQAIIALEAGRRALTQAASPHIAPLLADLATIYQTLGRPTEAIAVLREACAINPHSHTAHLRLGTLLREHSFPTDAVEVLNRAQTLRSSDAVTLFELGRAHEALGQPEPALAAYQKSALARPANPEPFYCLGRLTLDQCRAKVPGASAFHAIAALTECVSRAPDHAEAHALLAQAHQLTHEPQRALEDYQRALQLAPTRTEWSLGLGQVCLDLQKNDVAVAVLHDALTHAPANPEIHLALARAYAQSNLWSEVLPLVESALPLDPENPAFFQLQAEAHTHQHQPDRALVDWQNAVRLNPRDAAMQIRYAQALLGQNRADEARLVFGHALDLDPDAPAIHLAAGRAFLELDEVDHAYETLARAAQFAPHSAETHAAFGHAAARAGKHDTAHSAFIRASEIEPDNSDHLREAGEALWRLNRTTAAVALWNRAHMLNPKDNRTLARLGIALVHLNQPADALEKLERAAIHNPGDAEVAREAARAALALKQLDRAAHYLERVVNLAPSDAEARFLLGAVREQQGAHDAALTLYRQAERLNPGEGRYVAAAAETLAHLGDLNEAVTLMDRALAISPDSAEVQQRAGELYLRAHQPAPAAHAFAQLVAARPRDPQAHLALGSALVTLAENGEYLTRAGLTTAKSNSEPDLPARMLTALNQASALGADPYTVRYWLGRAKACAGDPQEARALLESILTTATEQLKDAHFYRALGTALRKTGEPDRAREVLQTALNHDDPALYLELGHSLTDAGDTRGALAAYKRVVALAPDWPTAHYHLGEALAALGETAEAAQVLQRAVTLQPTAAAWHYRLAQIYQARRETPTALAHFQRAVELEPTRAAYTADLARALAKDGDLVGAVNYFQRATDTNPQNADLWAERGQAHLALKDLMAAATCFAHAVELHPAHLPALRGSARASLALKDLHTASLTAEAAARLAPDDPEVLTCLADVQALKGDLEGAERSYNAVVAKAKDPAPALFALGRLYFDNGRIDQALDMLEKAAAANPISDEIFAALGDAHHAAGNHAPAVAAYRQASQLSPRNPHHLFNLGRVLRGQGQLDQALTHLHQARDILPQDEGVLSELGAVYESRKEYDRALEMFQRAAKVAPRSAMHHVRLGLVHKQVKDYAAAAAAFERALSLDPKHLEATKQLAIVGAAIVFTNDVRVKV